MLRGTGGFTTLASARPNQPVVPTRPRKPAVTPLQHGDVAVPWTVVFPMKTAGCAVKVSSLGVLDHHLRLWAITTA